MVLNGEKMAATGFRAKVTVEEGMEEIVKEAKEGSKQ